jgi:hypothetical protein
MMTVKGISVYIFLLILLLVNHILLPAHISLSIAIIITIIFFGYKIGFVSIPIYILIQAYFPVFAFLFSWVNDGVYVNSMNYYLQDDLQLISMAVEQYLLSICTTVFMLLFILNKSSKQAGRFKNEILDFKQSSYLLILFSLFSLFFYWLADPGDTILTTTYTLLLEQRFENTQYAGSLGSIFWLVSFIYYKKYSSEGRDKNIAIYVFIICTLISIIWLFLHSKRSEVMFIVLSYLFYEIQGKKTKKVLYLSIFMVAGLYVLGQVREILSISLQGGFIEESSNVNLIYRLPGGASNVFMSYVITIDYYSDQALLHGKTFFNYLLQLPPSNVSKLFGYTPPANFDSSGVFDNYAWNGGINFMSIFHANFGYIGAIISGLFVAFYIKLVEVLFYTRYVLLKAASLFMFGYASTIFWYELVIFIKPLVLLISLFFLTHFIIKSNRYEY